MILIAKVCVHVSEVDNVVEFTSDYLKDSGVDVVDDDYATTGTTKAL